MTAKQKATIKPMLTRSPAAASNLFLAFISFLQYRAVLGLASNAWHSLFRRDNNRRSTITFHLNTSSQSFSPPVRNEERTKDRSESHFSGPSRLVAIRSFTDLFLPRRSQRRHS